MASHEEIYAAIRKADAAGDADAVRQLAGYLETVTPAATDRFTTRKGKREVSFEVPQGADDAAIREAAIKATGSDIYRGSAVDRKRARIEAPNTSATEGFRLGAGKPGRNIAEWIKDTPIGAGVDAVARTFGQPTIGEAVDDYDARLPNNTRTGYQALGNIAGTLPLAAVPGALTTGGMVAQGAASGALLSDAQDAAGTAWDAGVGAVGSVVGSKALQGLGALARGVTDKGLRQLRAAGVPLTIGQIASTGSGIVSRTVNKAEEALTSVPIIGDVINAARDRGIEGLNLAAGNRILANVNEKMAAGTKVGWDMLDHIGDRLSTRYQRLVPSLSAKVDNEFATAVTAARDLADEASRADALTKIVNNVLGKRAAGGTISGQQLKDAEAELTRRYTRYARSTGDEGLFGEALDMVRQALRDAVRRSNPDHADDLQALNTGWAQLKGVRDAVRAGGQNSQATGTVTPGALLRQSGNKGYRDELAESAVRVLPNRTPDSGTARRMMTSLGMLGAAGSAGAGAAINPALALPAVGSMLYTRPGQRALNAVAFGSRPAAVSAAAVPLNQLSRYAPQVVTPLLVAPQD